MGQIICSFDIELRQPIPKERMSPDQRDTAILKNADRVSVFWITENLRRARLVGRLEKSGLLKLDGSCDYPWLKVKWKA